MKNIFLLFIVLFSSMTLAKAQSVQVQEISASLPLYSKIYDDERDPFNDAVAAISLAKATNRNVLIEIGGNWCTWCHKMDSFLEQNPDIYKSLHQEFVVLKINVSDSNENEAFMKGLPPVLGYPHMYVSTSSGKMVLSKDTAELQEDGKYAAANWRSFINQWKSSATNVVTQQQVAQGL